MTIAGMYEIATGCSTSGSPPRSGIGGGIISVARRGLSPPCRTLDAAGKTVQGRLVARYLARALGLDMLASAPGAYRVVGDRKRVAPHGLGHSGRRR